MVLLGSQVWGYIVMRDVNTILATAGITLLAAEPLVRVRERNNRNNREVTPP